MRLSVCRLHTVALGSRTLWLERFVDVGLLEFDTKIVLFEKGIDYLYNYNVNL